jgi:DNA-binding NarL/FixJ family response regulator
MARAGSTNSSRRVEGAGHHQPLVLIVDDHPVFRSGLRGIIEASQSFRVAEAGDARMALALVRDLKPDVVVLDIDMPGGSGLEVARALQHEPTPPALTFLTLYKEEELFNEAMDSGALGYLLKDSTANEIVSALRSVLAGRAFLSASISQFLINRQRGVRNLLEQRPGLATLTTSERRILKLVSQNHTSKEIAEELHVSPHTVENHRTNISAKLGLQGAHSLVKFAFDNRSRL